MRNAVRICAAVFIAAIISHSAVAVPIGARTIALGEAAAALPTARDYVQSGLISQFDGIENDGYGVHTSRVTPRDLISGVECSRSGSTSVGENYFRATSGAYYTFTSSSIKNAIGNKNFTIQLVFKSTKTANGGIFSIGNRGIWLYSNGSYNISTLNILTTSWAVSVQPNIDDSGIISFTITGGETPKYYYGLTDKNAVYGSMTAVDSNNIYLGALNAAFHSSDVYFYEVRLYDHNLTEDEIRHNYNIDKARFNLP